MVENKSNFITCLEFETTLGSEDPIGRIDLVEFDFSSHKRRILDTFYSTRDRAISGGLVLGKNEGKDIIFVQVNKSEITAVLKARGKVGVLGY